MPSLPAAQADASWVGARPYVALPAGEASAGWSDVSIPPATGYVPQGASESDASWVGALAYTPQTAGTADAAFATQGEGPSSGLVAQGFRPTTIGAAGRYSRPPLRICVASGWSSTAVGNPHTGVGLATHAHAGVSFGWPTTTIHIVVGGELPPYTAVAKGFKVSKFGAATGRRRLHMRQGPTSPTTAWGAATTRCTVHAQAVAPSGGLGVAEARTNYPATASGQVQTSVGSPTAVCRVRAKGWQAAAPGIPSASATLYATTQGWSLSGVGVAVMAARCRAVPLPPTRRWGTPVRTWSIEC